ncbi:unnamed protein product, partial [Ectocarpus fasciculatus]
GSPQRVVRSHGQNRGGSLGFISGSADSVGVVDSVVIVALGPRDKGGLGGSNAQLRGSLIKPGAR